MNLTDRKREDIKVSELARLILRLVLPDYAEDRTYSDPVEILNELWPDAKIGGTEHTDFCFKCFEAIELLKRRGLVMEIPYAHVPRNWSHTVKSFKPLIFPTSAGKRIDLQSKILILVDDAEKIVKLLRAQIPYRDLDTAAQEDYVIVEQYYLEAICACQQGLYISSVICLGAASEKAVHCLADAMIRHDATYEKGINAHRRQMSDLVDYLSIKIDLIFDQIADRQLVLALKDKLDLIAHIYRLNRNKAGHPKDVPNIGRCMQETHLGAFHQYCETLFEGVRLLTSNL